jgi:hypothetical protein
MATPTGELRLTCHPQQAAALVALARAVFPVVGEPRGPYPNRRRRRGDGDLAAPPAAEGMVRIYLDLALDHARGGGERPTPAAAVTSEDAQDAE